MSTRQPGRSRRPVSSGQRDERDERRARRKAPAASPATLSPARGRGAAAAIAGRILDLQAAGGNHYVHRLLHPSAVLAQAPGTVARDDGAATEEAAGQTVIKPVVNKSYPVSGKKLATAVKQIEAYQKAHGEAGLTTWKPKVSYKYDSDGNVKSAKVTVTIAVTLPKWPGAAKLSDAAKSEWDRAYGELADHEDKHVGIIKSSLEGAADSLIGLSKAEAAATFKQLLKDTQKASDDIDPYEVVVDLDVE